MNHPTSAVPADHLDVHIRPMAIDDLSAIVALDARVNGQPRANYFERRLASAVWDRDGSDAVFLVAQSTDEVAGFIMGALTYGEFGLPQTTALIDSIAIEPAFARRGLGNRLVTEFVAASRVGGATAIYTLVNWDAWELLTFFHSLGFALAPTIPLELRLDGNPDHGH